MKKLFFSLVALVMATMSYAQSNLVATLSHEGEISVFHGSNSLRDAMAAADHGDIITLASGRYNSVNITKAITLRGAGTEADDTSTGASRTEIVGNFNINIPSTEKHLTIEGIYHDGDICTSNTLNNPMLQKCRFKSIYYNHPNVDKVYSLTCINCRITGVISLPRYTNSSAKFINCVVTSPRSSDNGMNGSMELKIFIPVSMSSIGEYNFLDNIFYEGTESQWKKISTESCSIVSSPNILFNCSITRLYNYFHHIFFICKHLIALFHQFFN